MQADRALCHGPGEGRPLCMKAVPPDADVLPARASRAAWWGWEVRPDHFGWNDHVRRRIVSVGERQI